MTSKTNKVYVHVYNQKQNCVTQVLHKLSMWAHWAPGLPNEREGAETKIKLDANWFYKILMIIS